MIDFEGVRVSASHHATDQALKRVPLLRGATRTAAVRWVERTAAKAIIGGRTARTMPRWCAVGKTRLPRRAKVDRTQGVSRFAWNEAETAVLMIKRAHSWENKHGAGWVVLTVMVPTDAAEAA